MLRTFKNLVALFYLACDLFPPTVPFIVGLAFLGIDVWLIDRAILVWPEKSGFGNLIGICLLTTFSVVGLSFFVCSIVIIVERLRELPS